MRFTLRLKLAMLSLLLLTIPLAGFRIGALINQELIQSREKTLLFSSKAVASALSGRTGLFDEELFHAKSSKNDLYLYHLENPIRLNGKLDDWGDKIFHATEFGGNDLFSSASAYFYDSLHFTHLAGVRGKYLYSFFNVSDDELIYRSTFSDDINSFDNLQIAFTDKQGTKHRFLIAPEKPGWVNGLALQDLQDPDPSRVLKSGKKEPNIQAVWSETEDGYTVELRIPMQVIGARFGFSITDVDYSFQPEHRNIVGTLDPHNLESIGWLLTESGKIESILSSFVNPQSRVLIVDVNKRVRATYGELGQDSTATSGESGETTESTIVARLQEQIHNLFSPLYKYFTKPFPKNSTPSTQTLSMLHMQGIDEALLGKSTITHYQPDDLGVEIMAAIHPLQENEEIVGAVVVEQTTNSILALQNKVIEESLTLTIVVFSFGGIGLILFAFNLSLRVRRLGRQARAAIDSSGHVTATIEPSLASDEIGDLSRSLNSMLIQLKSQIEFREKMADNLEHELRTPLAGISASLKNIDKELETVPPHISKYLEWALQDLERMDSLLVTIRDANNLQEALRQDIPEEFAFDKAIAMWLKQSWQTAFPEVKFRYQRSEKSVKLYGDPGRLHQMMDKLIDNAVSFHDANSPITIELAANANTVTLSVTNHGPPIPNEIRSQIFNSMFSQRKGKDTKPHLGLGLYVVRTIVSHHGGKVRLTCNENKRTVTFRVKLPRYNVPV